MSWNFKKYGTASDPVHKSDLNGITGDYGCDRQFRFKKDAIAAGDDNEGSVSGKAAAGNATHETLARALGAPELAAKLCAPGGTYQVSRKQIDEVFHEEMTKETAGRDVRWGKDNPEKIEAERVSMIVGVLNNLHKHVAEVLLVEAGFIVEIDGYWLSGHVDLIYRPRVAPETIGLSDWKTGAQKPCAIELDHGWESGIYSLALDRGEFIDRRDVRTRLVPIVDEHGKKLGERWEATCRKSVAFDRSEHRAKRKAMEAALIDIAETVSSADPSDFNAAHLEPTFGTFPSVISHVHLGDYVPYQKAGKKEIKRPEDCAYFNVLPGTTHHYAAGELRGPAWLPVRRTEHDIPRLASMLRDVIGNCRMGRFVARIGEKCERCPFKLDCLTSGYAVRGEEKKQLERALRVIDFEDGDDSLSGL